MINERRKLTGGRPIWEASTPHGLATRKTPRRACYDVVIVGCGVTGAFAAEALSRLGVSVLVVDRREPAAGSTSASTALIQWEIDEPLSKLQAKLGSAKANACYVASFRAVQSLKRKLARWDIRCEARARDTVLLQGDVMGVTALQREAKARRRIGLPSQFLSGRQLAERYGFPRDGCIRSRGSLELDPRQLTLALARRARRRGVEIVAPAAVTAMHSTPLGVLMALADGTLLTARKVVAATGYEVMPEIPSEKYDLVSTWALATVRQPPHVFWKGRALVWEASDPYLYLRTTADDRLVVGGEDAPFVDTERRDRQIATKTRRILQKLGEWLPEADLSADFAWAGTFAQSPTGLPVMGPIPEQPNVFAILGAGGNGITFSVIAADLVTAWVAGRKHPLAPLFAP